MSFLLDFSSMTKEVCFFDLLYGALASALWTLSPQCAPINRATVLWMLMGCLTGAPFPTMDPVARLLIF